MATVKQQIVGSKRSMKRSIKSLNKSILLEYLLEI